MHTSSTGESTRRSSHSSTHYDGQRAERRQKVKSSQSYSGYYGRRPSRQEGDSDCNNNPPPTAHANEATGGVGTTTTGVVATPSIVEERAGLPPVNARSTTAIPQHEQASAGAQAKAHAATAHAITTTAEEEDEDEAADGARDEDEKLAIVGKLKALKPFHQPQLSEPVINIAVIGAEGVGKSTFVQKALELPDLPAAQSADRKIPIAGNTYIVRLLEVPIEDIDLEDDDTISWPDTIEDKMMPRLDGALALYDVKDKTSIEELPEMLNALTKASLPTVLISTKCDTPADQREIDPTTIEQNAKRAIGAISTLRVSAFAPESPRRGIFMLLDTIVNSQSAPLNRSPSAHRRRAQSNTVNATSAQNSDHRGHARSSSGYTAGTQKDSRRSRHDSTLGGRSSGSHLRVLPQDEHMHGSFLLEESASEPSRASSQSSESVDPAALAGTTPTSSNFSENGASFDELVDRLLTQPTSRSDLKFAPIFLALYRKFAAPGKLLEAIVERFYALERDGSPYMLKTQIQLRYVNIIEQWAGAYGGDFAHPKTKRRLRTFACKLAQIPIFAQAAKEISLDLDNVREDDDTNWAYCDKDREASADRTSMSSTASTLIDDPMFAFESELSGSTINEDGLFELSPKPTNLLSAHIEQAQKQARLLQAIPRHNITKLQWRALMEQPDESIAMELTRMDWVMFSSIRPRDLVRHVSLSQEQKAACRNLTHVTRMIDHFNQLAHWVANYVLLREKPKHRVLMLEKFMRIARKLRELNNYNALGAIIAGIKSTSVHRLAATRDLLPPAVGKDFMRLEALMAASKSHSAYRLAWENSSSERIPYLPLHRRDLATAEEGNRTFLGDESDGRINWKKFEMMGDSIVSLQKAQGVPYKNLGGAHGNEQVRELVLDVKLITDEEELYERSLQCEPPANMQSTGAKFKEFFKR